MTGAKVLIVDDESSIRIFLARVLEREGYSVQVAADGREALERLENQAFDVMISDIKMGLMDGVALLQEARQRFPDLAVILLTGHATIQSAVTALREEAYNYLLKPVKNEEVIAAVADALQKRARRQTRDQLEVIASQFAGVLDGSHSLRQIPDETRIQCGGLMLDEASYLATLDERRLDLTPTEFRLLKELAAAPGTTFDFVKLVQSACGYACSRQEAREIIGTHVLNLRSKLGIEPDEILYIESVRGIGYRIIPPGASHE
jgi:DNA-binding response OmpR family regulator